MSSVPFLVTDAWKAAYPGAVVGILAMRGVDNPASHPAVEELKQNAQTLLQEQFDGQDRAALKELEQIKAYEAYYSKYGQQYHVLMQLESIALKGKPFASTGALVQVMFVAEVGNLILTAGHDLDTLVAPLTLDIARGDETYTLYHGKEVSPKQGDMMISDAQGIISTVILGPDARTRIHSGTKNVLFAAYAPAGIGKEAMMHHLEDMQNGCLLIAPDATTEMIEVFEA